MSWKTTIVEITKITTTIITKITTIITRTTTIITTTNNNI